MINRIMIACRYINPYNKLAEVINNINSRYLITVVTNETALNKTITEFKPDILFIDSHFVLCATTIVTAGLCKKYKKMKTVVFERKPLDIKRAAYFILWGAESYLRSCECSHHYEKEIKRILQGEVIISDSLYKMLEKLNMPKCSLNFNNTDKKVLIGLSRGLTNNEIAEYHHLKPATVRNAVTNLYKKTNTFKTVMLLKVAVNRGVISKDWILERHDDNKYDLPEYDSIFKTNMLLKIGISKNKMSDRR